MKRKYSKKSKTRRKHTRRRTSRRKKQQKYGGRFIYTITEEQIDKLKKTLIDTRIFNEPDIMQIINELKISDNIYDINKIIEEIKTSPTLPGTDNVVKVCEKLDDIRLKPYNYKPSASAPTNPSQGNQTSSSGSQSQKDTKKPSAPTSQENQTSSSGSQRQNASDSNTPSSEIQLPCPSENEEPKPLTSQNDYREQSRMFHPDKNTGCPDDATVKFQKLKELYDQYTKSLNTTANTNVENNYGEIAVYYDDVGKKFILIDEKKDIKIEIINIDKTVKEYVPINSVKPTLEKTWTEYSSISPKNAEICKEIIAAHFKNIIPPDWKWIVETTASNSSQHQNVNNSSYAKQPPTYSNQVNKGRCPSLCIVPRDCSGTNEVERQKEYENQAELFSRKNNLGCPDDASKKLAFLKQLETCRHYVHN